MEEFEKESERVSETFTTVIRHGRQIEGVGLHVCNELLGRWKQSKLQIRMYKTTCAYY